MPNIAFQHNGRLILAANPTSHEKAIEEAKNLFCLETSDIIFYLDIASVGPAELAPSSWRSLRCGSLISAVTKNNEVAVSSPQVESPQLIVSAPHVQQLPPHRSAESRRSELVNKVALTRGPPANQCTQNSAEACRCLKPENVATSTAKALPTPNKTSSRSASSRRSEIINNVIPVPTLKLDCPKCTQNSAESCECTKTGSAQILDPVQPLETPTERISRPTLGRFHSENSPINLSFPLSDSRCLKLDEDSAEPWDCPRFCDFDAEISRKDKLRSIKEEDQDPIGIIETNKLATKTIMVQLEQASRVKNHRPLPTAMILGTEQRFQVVFGKVSSWTSEPPERIALTLIRGPQAINISPLSCPSHLGMVVGDKIRIRICPPLSRPPVLPRKAFSSDGIYWVRSFRSGNEATEQSTRRHLSHLSLPANPRPQKIATSLAGP
ncbi:hypothetical protein Pst134EA_007141 [Puccinia striiformis f. sp. tritici]|uniref:hypothetical protein n=1 Tax=Puccinia striiformis f. sp. tritici TaxID=168172 RepID=UPI002007CE0D|nr:hypothetical protein Pst134EA_007141 [Puccinia striiformis f. sp. tritici]KAH9469865.1 hypothetical protein Pst134EA_007141 [Puccinia striiformis f. sp. tritici]